MAFRDPVDLDLADNPEADDDRNCVGEIEANGDITVYSSTGIAKRESGNNQPAPSSRSTHTDAGEMLRDLLIRVDMARCILLTAPVPEEVIDLLETWDIHDRLKQEDGSSR